MAPLQNQHRRVVVPVMDDMFHDDSVGSRRQRFEEVAAFNSYSAHDAGTCERRSRTGDNMWKIEEHSSHFFMATQNRGQQKTVSPGYVHQRLDPFKIVRIARC